MSGYSYETVEGCRIAQWAEGWVQKNVASMSWTGECRDGLANGDGVMVVKLHNGKQKHYDGQMQLGYMTGKGTYINEAGWRYVGYFISSHITDGKIYTGSKRLLFDGKLISFEENYFGKKLTYYDGRYYRGNVYFTDGSYIQDGQYDGSIGYKVGSGDVDPATGSGLIYGKYIKNKKTLARYVNGTKYKDDSSYNRAVDNYLKKIGKERDLRIAQNSAADECKSKQESCEASCITQSVVSILGNSSDTSAQHRCTSQCQSESEQCLADINQHRHENPQRVAGSHTPPQSRPANISASMNVDKDAWTKRVCDTQCGMIVAEYKCKHIRDNRESMSCQMRNGAMQPDSPALCAQAKALSGCVTQAEHDASEKQYRFKGRKYGTVCERNAAKIEKVFVDKPIFRSTGTYDLVAIDMQHEVADIYKPCIGQSNDDARRYRQAMQQYTEAKRHCAGPHESFECLRWGPDNGVGIGTGGRYDNQAYYRQWRAEVDKALSDPNYSADMGPIIGRAPKRTSTAKTGPTTTTTTTKTAPKTKGTTQNTHRHEPRSNVPDAVATDCLKIDTDPGYGGFINTCNFGVNFTFCAYHPKKDSWAEAFDCEKNKWGDWQVAANDRVAAHTKGADRIFWGACRSHTPDDKTYGVDPVAVWLPSKHDGDFRCKEWGAK